MEKLGFGNFAYVIVALHFAIFESLIVYRNTHRPCYVSKRAYGCRIRGSELLRLGLMGVSVPSLHRESINSLIYIHFSVLMFNDSNCPNSNSFCQ